MTQEIIILRGKNVGQTIKDNLKQMKLYNKVIITNFDIKRDKVNRVIRAVITCKRKCL